MKLFKNLFLILSLVLASSSFAWAHGNHFHSLNDIASHIEDGDADEFTSDSKSDVHHSAAAHDDYNAQLIVNTAKK